MFLKMFIFRSLLWLARILRLKMISEKVRIFFHHLMEIIIRIRNEKGIVRPDMLQLMMENRGKKSKLDLIINDIVSQAIIFFFGGFDSISIVMCFYAYEIIINPSTQERLQSEIDKVLEEINRRLTKPSITWNTWTL